MTSASFGTIERYYARTLPIISDISRSNDRIRTTFFQNDENFVSDPIVAKYLIHTGHFLCIIEMISLIELLRLDFNWTFL